MVRTRTLVIVLVAVSLGLILFDLRGETAGVRSVVSGAVVPLQRAVTAVFRPVGDWVQSVAGFTDAEARQAQAQQILQQLELADERAGRERAGEPAAVAGRRPVPARVIAAQGSNARAWVTVDAGTSQGLAVGNAVLGPLGMIGVVRSVDARSAQVRLLTDPESRIGARLATSGEMGSVDGAGGAAPLEVTLLNPAAEVAPGDLLITLGSPEPAGVPPGLPLATVIALGSGRADAGQVLQAAPTGSTTRADHVVVLIDGRGGSTP